MNVISPLQEISVGMFSIQQAQWECPDVADHRKNVAHPSEIHKTQHYEKEGGKS